MASAKFPAVIWDGSSASRSQVLDHEPVGEIHREPDGADWAQIVAEMVAVQEVVQAGSAGSTDLADDLAALTTTVGGHTTTLSTLSGTVGGHTTTIGTHTTDLTRLKLLTGSATTAALATTATSGFAFLPTMTGTPTGVPASVPAGFKAAVYDTTAKKIWIYDGSWTSTSALT